MISSALYRFFGMVQISSGGCLPLSIWTSYSGLRQAIDEDWRVEWWYQLKLKPDLESLHDEPEFQAMVAEIEADMAGQLERVREMERNGELEPIPELAAE